MAPPAYRGPWLTLRLAVLARDGYRCQLRLPNCKGQATQVDHIIGLAQGGQPWNPDNCRASCRSCNVAKGNRDNPRGQPWQRLPNPSRQW